MVQRADGGSEEVSDENLEAAAEHYDRIFDNKENTLTISLVQHCHLCAPHIDTAEQLGRVESDDAEKTIYNPKIPDGQEIVLRPDYNPHGTLMGFHIRIRKENNEE